MADLQKNKIKLSTQSIINKTVGECNIQQMCEQKAHLQVLCYWLFILKCPALFFHLHLTTSG